MIKFAQAVGLEVSLPSHSIVEDLLMKVRVGSVGQPVTLPYLAGRLLFPSFAGSIVVDSVDSRSVHSVPTYT